MIDLEHALSAFDEYLKNYPNTGRINLKVAHTKRVMNSNIRLAQSLQLSDEDVALAGLIGLLHDIGRFEQVKRYDTFVDSISVNHAMFSSEQLFEEGLIRRFIEDSEYDSIIKAAVENHNRLDIEPGLSERALLHSKLVRDSDKIDIYVQVLESDAKLVFDGPHKPTDSINEKIFRDFMDHKCIDNKDLKCKSDDLVRKVAMIFGLYYPQSLKALQEQDLINRLVAYFKSSFEFGNEQTLQRIDLVNTIAAAYIKQKIKSSKIPDDQLQL